MHFFFAVVMHQTFLFLVVSLKLQSRVEDLSGTMTSTLALVLIHLALEQKPDFSSLARMLRYGNRGLMQAWIESCSIWSEDTALQAKSFFAGNRSLELDILPPDCLKRLRLPERTRLLDEAPLLELLLNVDDNLSPKGLERFEQAEPSGLWWRLLVPKFDWNKVWVKLDDYKSGPLFRVGMVDFFINADRKMLLRAYSPITNAHNDTPDTVFRSIYGLMRADLIDHVNNSRDEIATILKTINSNFHRQTEFQNVSWIIRFWLCAFTNRSCDLVHAKDMFSMMIDSELGIRFEKENYLAMNAMISIILSQGTFGIKEQQALLDRIIPVLLLLNDLDLSNFLWDVYNFSPLVSNDLFKAQLILNNNIRRRLLSIAPFRDTDLPSLLYLTRDGIGYFRRWMVEYTSADSLSDFIGSASDPTSSDFLLHLAEYWTTNIPKFAFGGIPIVTKLKQFLKVLLETFSAVISIVTEKDSRRVWVNFEAFNANDLDHVGLVALLLRIRLHHEDENVAIESQENTYDLCTETVNILRKKSLMISAPLNIVYPLLPGELTRSKRCRD